MVWACEGVQRRGRVIALPLYPRGEMGRGRRQGKQRQREAVGKVRGREGGERGGFKESVRSQFSKRDK